MSRCLSLDPSSPCALIYLYQGGTVTYAQQMALITSQLARLDRLLADAEAAGATWIVVVGHYEVFSGGDHGDISEMKR